MPRRISHAETGCLPKPHGGRWGAFLATWLVLGLIWCVLLPRIASRPAIRARLDDLAAQGIDASAMYYTELPAMDDVLQVLNEFRERHPLDLWTPYWSYIAESEVAGIEEPPAPN